MKEDGMDSTNSKYKWDGNAYEILVEYLWGRSKLEVET